MTTLVAAVREQLKMQSSTPLSLRDASNRRLISDQELQQAVEAGAGTRTLLSAVLTDAALNELEARRDDMAQMQWQLLRESESLLYFQVNLSVVRVT